jgi:hypothetical protein
MMLLPKSSLLLLSIVLIYVFHTTFDLGLKVRLFCSPQWLNQSTESPILFRSCGHETQFSDQMGHQKSGIPCSVLYGVVACHPDTPGNQETRKPGNQETRKPGNQETRKAGKSSESPIFDAPFWSENGVSCPQCGHERNKIGDSVLCRKVS